MDVPFTEIIDPINSNPFEAELNFVLGDMSKGLLASFQGELTGPHCKFARTLPTTFPIPECVCLPDISHCTQKRITDPCYWTPALPYLYDFKVELSLQDQAQSSANHTVGFKRWEVEGQSFRLERRRTVLRGVVAGDEANVELSETHDAELAVLVTDPSEDFLQQASEDGVMVVADIRDTKSDTTPRLLSMAWQPSVALVLPDPDMFYVPSSLVLGETITAEATSSTPIEDFARVLIVELTANERPPEWLANVDKPVIAIRRGVDYADLTAARAACDKLQAELAPEFDLAGYFVAP